MKLLKSPQGYYTSTIDDTGILLYLTKELLPSDNSLEKLKYIARKYNIDKNIIALPDLHFKVKNFIPSGMVTPIRGYFSPQLLGPNNDGMGSLKFRIKGGALSEGAVSSIFNAIKERIVMFRRESDIINRETLNTIFHTGIQEVIEEWGFSKKDLDAFEDKGCVKKFKEENIASFFPKSRPKNLPSFVPDHDVYKSGKKCIGVLDGTSHFIELFKVDKSLNLEKEKNLNIEKDDYFFLIHAGAGDVCIASHREYLGKNDNKYGLNTDIGQKAYNSFAVAGNYGYANRLYIYKVLKEVLEEFVPKLEFVEIFSDVPHDYIELHKNNDLFIHRKGAAKIFPGSYYKKGHKWRDTGTPYLFPSCVGGDAYIISNSMGNPESLYTVSHGAGRLIRKDKAIDLYKNNNLDESMKYKIKLFRYGVDQIEGQNPLAFKDMDVIMKTLEKFNLSSPISKLRPIASLKA
jgi:tRNA-splicing ligase RtcB (3'-phosphate/5'-hydroxy nucleic acid ligase)